MLLVVESLPRWLGAHLLTLKRSDIRQPERLGETRRWYSIHRVEKAARCWEGPK